MLGLPSLETDLMKISQRTILMWGCLLAALSVMIGAFGAHALKPLLLSNNRIETFELAVRYQFYHTLGILLVGVMANRIHSGLAVVSFVLFTLGIVFFSGSLYHLSLTNQTSLVWVTPVGGLLFISGWATLSLAFWRMHRD